MLCIDGECWGNLLNLVRNFIKNAKRGYWFALFMRKLCLTLKDDTTDNKRKENERQNANASAKSK